MSDAHYILNIEAASGETSSRTLHNARVVIGRREGDIVIDDTGASGQHAELVLSTGKLIVKDLKSTNGIVWQGAIVRDAFDLHVGETFQIGRTKFTLQALHDAQVTEIPSAPEEDEGEEATAFISPAELGMEDVNDAPPSPHEPPSRPAPALEVAAESTPPQPATNLEEQVDDDEEEATAWMNAMDEAPQTEADWRDEAAPERAALQKDTVRAAQSEQTPAEAPPAEAPPAAMNVDAPLDIRERRPNFQGRGDELIKLFVIHGLLTLITFGIYTPWFLCKFVSYLASRTVFGPTQGGWVYIRFHGDGGSLFVKFLIGYLLSMVTLGVYAAWFICDLTRWFLERSDAVAEDGTVYQVQFTMSGGELFVAIFVNYLLTAITMGIYGAWAYCKVRAQVVEKLVLIEDGEAVGGMRFNATGGQLLPFALVQWLLCVVTLFIYVPWAFVKLTQFMNRHTQIYYRQRWFQGDFTGRGGAYFKLHVIGIVLTQLTLGIYYAWYYASKRTFETNHEVWYELN